MRLVEDIDLNRKYDKFYFVMESDVGLQKEIVRKYGDVYQCGIWKKWGTAFSRKDETFIVTDMNDELDDIIFDNLETNVAVLEDERDIVVYYQGKYHEISK